MKIIISLFINFSTIPNTLISPPPPPQNIQIQPVKLILRTNTNSHRLPILIPLTHWPSPSLSILPFLRTPIGSASLKYPVILRLRGTNVRRMTDTVFGPRNQQRNDWKNDRRSPRHSTLQSIPAGFYARGTRRTCGEIHSLSGSRTRSVALILDTRTRASAFLQNVEIERLHAALLFSNHLRNTLDRVLWS